MQGSHCGLFVQAQYILNQKFVDMLSLINLCYTSDEGQAAFQHIGQKGVLKVLVLVYPFSAIVGKNILSIFHEV